MYKCYIDSTTEQQTNEQMFHAVFYFPLLAVRLNEGC